MVGLVERERQSFFGLGRVGRVPRAPQSGRLDDRVNCFRVGRFRTLAFDLGVVGRDFAFHRLRRRLRHAVEGVGVQRLAHPTPAPPPFGTVAVHQGANHLASRGDCGEGREIDPQGNRCATIARADPPGGRSVSRRHRFRDVTRETRTRPGLPLQTPKALRIQALAFLRSGRGLRFPSALRPPCLTEPFRPGRQTDGLPGSERCGPPVNNSRDCRPERQPSPREHAPLRRTSDDRSLDEITRSGNPHTRPARVQIGAAPESQYRIRSDTPRDQ